MGVSVVGQFEQRIGEGPAGEFAMDIFSAVLAERVGELKAKPKTVELAVADQRTSEKGTKNGGEKLGKR